MKKILIINTVEFEYNGITKVILNLVNNLHKEFLLDLVACDKVDLDLKISVINNINCFYDFSFRKKNVLKYLYSLYKLIKSNNYDVIHIHGNSATMALESVVAKICGVEKIIAHCHNNSTNHPVVNTLLKPILKLTITDALACSNLAGNWLFGADNYEVFNNSIDTRVFQFNQSIRNIERHKLGIDDDEIVLGHVGLFNEQKNQLFLLNVLDDLLKRNEKYKLLLVGHGPLKNRFIDEVNKRNLNNNVLILEKCSNVQDILMAMDYFLFPSKWEGFGIALLEAQASGLLCIASDKVSRDVNVTHNIHYLSLENVEDWIDFINSPKHWERNKLSISNIDKIKQQNLDLVSSYKMIRSIYK